MWTLTTSRGQRVDGIAHEETARRTVHSLGITELIGAYSWHVTDNQGQRFVAEIRHTVGAGR